MFCFGTKFVLGTNATVAELDDPSNLDVDKMGPSVAEMTPEFKNNTSPPETPLFPMGPTGPVAPTPVYPVGPTIPVGPVMPVGPVYPVEPVGPDGPVPSGPVHPVGPVTVLPGPVGPVGPLAPTADKVVLILEYVDSPSKYVFPVPLLPPEGVFAVSTTKRCVSYVTVNVWLMNNRMYA